MKKKLVKIFSFLMIFCLSFLLVGCNGLGGSSSIEDLNEQLKNGTITKEEYTEKMKENLPVPLYGTKLLYRSTSSNMHETPEYENYYASFALWVSYYLTSYYGYYNTSFFEEAEEKGNLSENFDYHINNNEYVYDSIRYQISEISKISETQYITMDNAGNETINKTIIEEGDTNYQLSVKTNLLNKWNWTYDYNSDPEAFVNTNEKAYVQFKESNTDKTTLYYNFRLANISIFKERNSAYYEDTIYPQYLSQLMLKNNDSNLIDIENIGTSIQNIADNNLQSDVVKAIEYLLYCYSLNYTPNGIKIDGQNVEVFGYDSVDDALEFIKTQFDKHGSYIGFSENNKQQLVSAILDTVIGAKAKQENKVKEKTGVVAKIYFADEDALKSNTPSSIVLDDSNAIVKEVEVERNYEQTIKNIIDIAYTYVSIGTNTEATTRAEDNSLHINQRYLNSQMQDVWGTGFSLSVRLDGGDEFNEDLPAREYQSALLMFYEEANFDNLIIAFRYAGNGVTEGFDENQYIELKVGLNGYINGHFIYWEPQRIKVPAGEYDASGFFVPNGFSQHADFQALQSSYKSDEGYHDFDFDERTGIKVGKFNPYLGGGALYNDSGMDMYSGTVMTGNPIKLLGTTKLKDYYRIVESSESDNLGANQYYTSGRFNHEKLVGADQCDYIEITYDIIKTSGDFDKNYAFQTGIFMML